MNAVVLIYTMRCNIRCEHCLVDSHPGRSEKMDVDRALDLIRGVAALPEVSFIDITGGEPMMYAKEIAALARAARDAGKQMRIVSNGYWSKSVADAEATLREMMDAGVASIGLSIDEWHLPFIISARVHHYVAACRRIGWLPLLSCVVCADGSPPPASGLPAAACALLERYGVPLTECVDLYEWNRRCEAADGKPPGEPRTPILVNWQYLTGEGRARNLPVPTQAFRDSPAEPCTMAGRMPTLDEEGRLYPCCSPWTNRKSHALAHVSGATVATAMESLRREPLVDIIHRFGPKRLIDAARGRGATFPSEHSGICNQCGLLMDRFSLEELRRLAAEVLEDMQLEPWLQALGLSVRRPRSFAAGSDS